jgi:hypothetical protein
VLAMHCALLGTIFVVGLSITIDSGDLVVLWFRMASEKEKWSAEDELLVLKEPDLIITYSSRRTHQALSAYFRLNCGLIWFLHVASYH